MEMPKGLEMLKKLRDGESVTCPKCNKGIVIPKGDCKITKVFHCEKCDYSVTID